MLYTHAPPIATQRSSRAERDGYLLREWIGIEPTRRLCSRLAGFEAQGGHQSRVHSPTTFSTVQPCGNEHKPEAPERTKEAKRTSLAGAF